MVELSGLPVFRRVTLSAALGGVVRFELSVMNIFVTALAVRAHSRERDYSSRGTGLGLMTA